MLLAIDTATRILSLALYHQSAILAEYSIDGDRQQSALLAPTLQQLLETSKVTLSDLEAVGVSIGPGSYTGLRIGVAFAKGIASVRDIPLIGVTTLETLALAQPFYSAGYELIALVQAGRGRIIAQTFRGKKGRWQAHNDPVLLSWKELLEAIEDRTYLTGEINEVGWEALQSDEAQDLPITIIPTAHRLRRAGFLAEEAWRRLQAGDESDFAPASVLPVYMKAPG